MVVENWEEIVRFVDNIKFLFWCVFFCNRYIAGVFFQLFEFIEFNLFNYSGEYGKNKVLKIYNLNNLNIFLF